MKTSIILPKINSSAYAKLVGAICAIGAGSALLSILLVPELFGSRTGADGNPPADRRILTVVTAQVEKQTAYQSVRSYLGTVEPRRMSQLGFEVPGKLERLLVEEGEFVEQGQLLAVLDVERLEAARNEAEAQLLEAEASLSLARATLARTTEAQKLKAVSIQQLDEAAANMKQQQARLARVKAQIERIDVDLDKAKLLAPYSGTLATRLRDEGTVLAAGQPILEIQETTSAEVRIGVNRNQLNRFVPGTIITGFVRDQEFEMSIDRVLPGRQNRTRVVEIIGVPRDLDLTLREGDLVEVAITDQVYREGFWLPISALTENGRGLWSCLIAEPIHSEDADHRTGYRLSRRDVEIISLEKDRVYVAGNVSADDQVVIEGLHRVVPNQHVRIVQTGASSGIDLASTN